MRERIGHEGRGLDASLFGSIISSAGDVDINRSQIPRRPISDNATPSFQCSPGTKASCNRRPTVALPRPATAKPLSMAVTARVIGRGRPVIPRNYRARLLTTECEVAGRYGNTEVGRAVVMSGRRFGRGVSRRGRALQSWLAVWRFVVKRDFGPISSESCDRFRIM